MKCATNVHHADEEGIAENVFKVRGQRSRSHVHRCMNATTAEVYILMVKQ